MGTLPCVNTVQENCVFVREGRLMSNFFYCITQIKNIMGTRKLCFMLCQGCLENLLDGLLRVIADHPIERHRKKTLCRLKVFLGDFYPFLRLPFHTISFPF